MAWVRHAVADFLAGEARDLATVTFVLFDGGTLAAYEQALAAVLTAR